MEMVVGLAMEMVGGAEHGGWGWQWRWWVGLAMDMVGGAGNGDGGWGSECKSKFDWNR